MTENASELTEAEREMLGLTHALACHYNCSGKCSTNECICNTRTQWAVVESILAARTAALRDEIAREIEARMGRDADYDDGLEDAADIARGGTR